MHCYGSVVVICGFLRVSLATYVVRSRAGAWLDHALFAGCGSTYDARAGMSVGSGVDGVELKSY